MKKEKNKSISENKVKSSISKDELFPKVSIVTPSYNQGQFIEETILSVLNQNYPNLEYIIIDGGSTDETVSIIRKYENRLSYWVSEQDEGQADAVNKGWRLASGEILGWINSDDVYCQNAVTLAVSALIANKKIGFVYGDAKVIDAIGNNISERKSFPYNSKKLITFDLVPSQPTVFIRRTLFESVGLLDKSLQMSMDTDYWFRLSRVVVGMNISHPIAFMRMHEEAKTTKRYGEFLEDSLYILRKTFDGSSFIRSIKLLRLKAYSRAYYGAAGRAYKAGVRREILPLAWHSLYLYPNPFDLKTYLSILMCLEALTGTNLLNKISSLHLRQKIFDFINCFRKKN